MPKEKFEIGPVSRTSAAAASCEMGCSVIRAKRTVNVRMSINSACFWHQQAQIVILKT